MEYVFLVVLPDSCMVIPVWFSLEKREGVISLKEFKYFSNRLQQATRFSGVYKELFDPLHEEVIVSDAVVVKDYLGRRYSGGLELLTDQTFYKYSKYTYHVMSNEYEPPAGSLSFSTLNPTRLSFFAVGNAPGHDFLLNEISNYLVFNSHLSYELGVASSSTSFLDMH